jgi:hypothetical protein
MDRHRRGKGKRRPVCDVFFSFLYTCGRKRRLASSKKILSTKALLRLFSGSFQTLFRPYSGSFKALSRLFQGSFQALFRLYPGSIQALPRLYQGPIKALLRLY